MRVGKWLVLVVYLLVLTKFILFKDIPPLNMMQMTDKSQLALRWESANLRPFQSIRLFLSPSNLTPSIRIQNLAGNVLLFVPLGLLLPLWFRRGRHFFYVTAASGALSLFYEVIQLLFGFGNFDVDDLLLNTIGGMTGYALFFLFGKRRRT